MRGARRGSDARGGAARPPGRPGEAHRVGRPLVAADGGLPRARRLGGRGLRRGGAEARMHRQLQRRQAGRGLLRPAPDAAGPARRPHVGRGVCRLHGEPGPRVPPAVHDAAVLGPALLVEPRRRPLLRGREGGLQLQRARHQRRHEGLRPGGGAQRLRRGGCPRSPAGHRGAEAPLARGPARAAAICEDVAPLRLPLVWCVARGRCGGGARPPPAAGPRGRRPAGRRALPPGRGRRRRPAEATLGRLGLAPRGGLRRGAPHRRPAHVPAGPLLPGRCLGLLLLPPQGLCEPRRGPRGALPPAGTREAGEAPGRRARRRLHVERLCGAVRPRPHPRRIGGRLRLRRPRLRPRGG
mmetsp:Transcript_94684/g.294971  ORF Transcript_94684/g.294971 Transcript_94684/m.294971 type:complete len:353 (-) Transcript_94684:5-1063(-)